MSFINKMNIGNISYDIQAGEKVQLTFPAGTTNGTLTEEQLAKLQANYQSCIEMVNDKELYYLNDPGHVEGYLTYSHVGIENSKATIKTLTITVSAKSFVIVTTVVPTESGGGKLYLHHTAGTMTTGDTTYDVTVFSKSLKSTVYTKSELYTELKGATCDIYKSMSGASPITCMGAVNENLQLYAGIYNSSGTFIKYLAGFPLSSFIEGSYTDTVIEL